MLTQALSGYRTVFANSSLRRLQLAYASSIAAEWATTVAIGVFAFERGGTLAVGVVGLVRMVPAAFATPLASFVADRFDRERVLLAVTAANAGALACAAAAYWAGTSDLLVYAPTVILAVLVTLTRTALQALLPSLARTPEELIASNGVSLTTESLGTLAGPLLAGVVVATSDIGTVFAGSAGLYVLGVVLLTGVRVEGRLTAPVKPESMARRLLAGFRSGLGVSRPRLIIALMCAQTFVRGALSVLIVVASYRLIGGGASWVGYLTAAFGAGGLLGAFASFKIVGRRLATPLAGALVLWGLPIALLGAWPNKAFALLLIAVIGAGNSIEDVAGFTLLQRIVPDDALGRVLGTFWGLATSAAGVGGLLVPPLVAAIGPRGACVATGCLLPLLVLLAWRRLAAIDEDAKVPRRELEFLSAVPMFAPLSVAAKEHVAASLLQLAEPRGATIIREGESGDRFYLIADGELDVTRDGRHVVTRSAGDFVGEIALLRDVPRTATVTARTDVELYALDRDDFLAAVTGHVAGQEAAHEVVGERLATYANRH